MEDQPEKPKKPERKLETRASCGAGDIYPGKVIRTTKDRKCQECGRDLPGPGNVPPEMVEAPCECGCCSAHGEKAQGRPLSEKEYRHLAVCDPFGEHGAPDARHENAAMKKRCGMCVHKSGAKGDWTCTLNPEGGVCYEFFCHNFSEITRKTRPSQVNPARLTIPAGVRFLYLGRPRQGERHQGVMTVAYSVDKEEHSVELGFSFCSSSDNWAKSMGQEFAINRLLATPVAAHYLYEPRKLAVQIAQAVMEHAWHLLNGVLYEITRKAFHGVPSWTIALARHLNTRKVSGISRLKLFERRSFAFPIPTTDSILRAMVQDILNLGGKP